MSPRNKATKRALDDYFSRNMLRILKGVNIAPSNAQKARNKRLSSKRIEHSVNYWYKQDNADIFECC